MNNGTPYESLGVLLTRFKKMAKAMPMPVADKKKVVRDELVARVRETAVWPGLLQRLVVEACGVYIDFLGAGESISVMMPVATEMGDARFGKMFALMMKATREDDNTLLGKLLTGLCKTDDGKYAIGCILGTVGIMTQLQSVQEAEMKQDEATRARVGLLQSDFAAAILRGKTPSQLGIKL